MSLIFKIVMQKTPIMKLITSSLYKKTNLKLSCFFFTFFICLNVHAQNPLAPANNFEPKVGFKKFIKLLIKLAASCSSLCAYNL